MTTTLSPAELEMWKKAAGRAEAERNLAYFMSRLKVQVPGEEPNKFALPPHVKERAESWQAGNSEIILKSRQVYMTWSATAFVLWKAQFTPNSKILVYSITERESQEIIVRLKFMHQQLPQHLKVGIRRATKGEIEFKNNSRVISYPSTEDAGRGETSNLVIVDEAASHPEAEANFASYQPTIARGGQVVMFSTGKGMHNLFYRLWESGQFKKVFIPWNPEGLEYRTEKWYEEQRALWDKLPDLFFQEFPSDEAEAFRELSGLVFPQFKEDLFVVKKSPLAWADFRYRVAGVDPGGGDPTAIVPLGIDKSGRFHQSHEFYRRGAVTIDEMAEWLYVFHRQASFDRILVDAPKDSPTVAQLRALGLPAEGATKDRQARLAQHAWVLENRRLTIHERCKESINEYSGYRWANRTDPNSRDRYQTSTPVDNHADAIDARGYAILWAMTRLLGGDPNELFDDPVPAIVEEITSAKDFSPWKRKKMGIF